MHRVEACESTDRQQVNDAFSPVKNTALSPVKARVEFLRELEASEP